MLSERAEQTRSWCIAVTGLLTPKHVKTISAACPSCGQRYIYRNHSGCGASTVRWNRPEPRLHDNRPDARIACRQVLRLRGGRRPMERPER